MCNSNLKILIMFVCFFSFVLQWWFTTVANSAIPAKRVSLCQRNSIAVGARIQQNAKLLINVQVTKAAGSIGNKHAHEHTAQLHTT